MKPVTITVATKRKDQVVDITDAIEAHLLEPASKRASVSSLPLIPPAR